MTKSKCVVCGHDLDNHVDEDDGWRCHSLGPDGQQCECYLRKDRADEEGLKYYEVTSRIKEYLEDVKASIMRDKEV